MVDNCRLCTAIEEIFSLVQRTVLHEDEIVRRIRNGPTGEDAHGDTVSTLLFFNQDSSLFVLQRIRHVMRRQPGKFRLVRRIGSFFVHGYWKCFTTTNVDVEQAKHERQLRLGLARAPRNRLLLSDSVAKCKTMCYNNAHIRSTSTSLESVDHQANLKRLRINVSNDSCNSTKRIKQGKRTNKDAVISTSSCSSEASNKSSSSASSSFSSKTSMYSLSKSSLTSGNDIYNDDV